MNEVRIDKWMWATRIFKTRTIAVEACKKNRVMINDVAVKPSRMIKVGDVIQVRKPPVVYSFKVLRLTQNRMGAKLVPEYLENITPPEQYEILELNKISGFVNRAKGTGRPTKKDRRNIDEFQDTPMFLDDDFDFDFDFEEINERS
ncbi:MAG: RNA-binding S4 domain-containing protein [Dysgonamonadaceae bacterium]|jgi:ribosome-associated heat shock protein Hsp15|nr:RNA-binding S4 domain-containing protein [Dysgonamonadaceae bacterium]